MFRTAAWRQTIQTSTPLQILVILAFWLIGEGLVRAAALPFPGAIAGLFLLLGLLIIKRIDVASVRRGARWFLAEMLLFFVPAVPAVLDHPEFMGLLGVKILAVILLGTVIVMVVTGIVVDLCYRAVLAREKEGHGAD